MNTSNFIKKPNEQELQELAVYLADKTFGAGSYTPGDLGEMLMQVEQAHIAVFDNYITDSPGYAGKVMVVVWSAGPEYHEVFIWSKINGTEHTRLINVPVARELIENHY